MSGHYERVNARDDDEPETPTGPTSRPTQQYQVPHSPPPSFRSRASSREQTERVDAALDDAFGSDDDDDEADDTQRLVRGNSFPVARDADNAGLRIQLGETTPQQSPLPAGMSAQANGRIYGAGIQADGVFSNLSAKPETGVQKEEQPPTYEQAAADSAPPYWETTILAPGLGGEGEVYIDGMPVGSVFSFIWNGLIAMSFQVLLVGFLLTYLLHSTHAAKNGSRAGLGITLIQFGFGLKATVPTPSSGMGNGGGHPGDSAETFASPPDPNAHDFDPSVVVGGDGGSSDGITSTDWFAYLLMIVGWFILIRAASDYLRVRRHEQLILQSPDRGLPVPIIATGESPETVV